MIQDGPVGFSWIHKAWYERLANLVRSVLMEYLHRRNVVPELGGYSY